MNRQNDDNAGGDESQGKERATCDLDNLNVDSDVSDDD